MSGGPPCAVRHTRRLGMVPRVDEELALMRVQSSRSSAALARAFLVVLAALLAIPRDR